MTFGVDDIIDTYGVVKGSYEEVSLPKIRAFRVDYVGGPARPAGPEGPDAPRFRLSSEPIPSTLEWGEVLVNFRAVPINPADLHPNRGADAGAHPRAPPFAAGSDGVGVVLKVGAGVKHLREGDWATPLAPGLGTWRSLATLKEKHLMKIPADLMPVEYAATWREMCVAYRLLEDSPELRPGDAVVVNGANGAVGAATLQLCALLKLRAVAVTRPRKGSNPDGDGDSSGFNPAVDPKTTARLLALGAAEVLADEGNLRDALERRRFFAKPKLGLDCVGGVSAARLADALQDGSRLVCFGCMSGRPVTLPWTSLVARGLRARASRFARGCARIRNARRRCSRRWRNSRAPISSGWNTPNTNSARSSRRRSNTPPRTREARRSYCASRTSDPPTSEECVGVRRRRVPPPRLTRRSIDFLVRETVIRVAVRGVVDRRSWLFFNQHASRVGILQRSHATRFDRLLKNFTRRLRRRTTKGDASSFAGQPDRVRRASDPISDGYAAADEPLSRAPPPVVARRERVGERG